MRRCLPFALVLSACHAVPAPTPPPKEVPPPEVPAEVACVGDEPEPGPTPELMCCHPDRERMREAIRAGHPAFARCFSGEGRLTLRVDVAFSGAVQRACGVESDLPAEATQCVLSAARGLRFDSVPEGTCPRMRITFPLVFN